MVSVIGRMYASTDELRDYIKDPSDRDQAAMENALLSASRTIESLCGRKFYQHTDTLYFDSYNLWEVHFGPHDIATTTGIEVTTDSSDTNTYAEMWELDVDYMLEPVNRSKNGIEAWPYDSMQALRGRWWPVRYAAYNRPTVKVTATWGWADVPDPIKQATLVLAADLYKNADAPFGVAGIGQFGALRVQQRNPTVYGLIRDYRKSPIASA